jgi:hypothetical protein
VLKVGLGVELSPLIVGIAQARLGRPFIRHDILQGFPTQDVMTCTGKAESQ